MLRTLNKDQLEGFQLEEIKYQYDSSQLIQVANDQPDGILLWEGKHQVLICDGGSDFNFGYDNVSDFIKHRLSVLDGDLNAFATELGYDNKPHFTKADFVIDLIESNFENMEDLVIESYNGTRLGDWLYE